MTTISEDGPCTVRCTRTLTRDAISNKRFSRVHCQPGHLSFFFLATTTKYTPTMRKASQMLTEFFGDNPRIEPGGLDLNEKWWVERQEALEQAGYMLRPRYRPGWKPPWAGTDKYHGNFEEGQSLVVRGDTSCARVPVLMKLQLRVCMDATRISDGRQVMLKMIPLEEGPYELEMNRLFSTEPLSSNPRNRCAPLLDVIQLPNEPPIMVHPLLRPFYDPRLQTFGEFVSFFAQACEVSPILSCMLCM